MGRFFKKEEKKPISFASVEMKKSSKKPTWIMLGLLFVLLVAVIIYLL